MIFAQTIRTALSQIIALYEKRQCTIAAIEEVPKDRTSSYGVIAVNEIEAGLYKVDEMVEKPASEDAPSDLAIIGRYILTPDIIDILSGTKPGPWWRDSDYGCHRRAG